MDEQKKVKKSEVKINRIQGTDGIRGEIELSYAPRVKNYSPLEAFIEKKLLTEKFFLLYAYSASQYLKKTKSSKRKTKIVLGWDPRDTNRLYIDAVKQGIKKAGCDVLSIGIVPTPLVPMFMTYKGADGGIMITASHNPMDQNGIKIFFPFKGLKPLPDDDEIITNMVIENEKLNFESIPEKGKESDNYSEARKLFVDFNLHSENSWVNAGNPFHNVILIVDPANGSYSYLASEIFVRLGFPIVIELNNDIESGNVNHNSGVASLEGHLLITPAMVFESKKSRIKPVFSNHLAIKRIFEEGRARVDEIKNRNIEVSGAVFDADGDRFYRLDYDPFKDKIIVSSGDETAFHQVKYLVESNSKKYKKSLYVNTVESDLLVSQNLELLDVVYDRSPVGDKWILSRTCCCFLLNFASKIKKSVSKKVDKNKIAKLLDEIETILNKGTSSIKDLIVIYDKLCKFKVPKSIENSDNKCIFSVGAEETGHNITEGFLEMPDGKIESIFAGNGLKSAVNTYAATHYLYNKLTAKEYFKKLREPFKRGYKKTFYAYYTDKRLFYKDSPLFLDIKEQLKKVFTDLFNGKNLSFEEILYPEEEDLLYFKVYDSKKTHICSMFMRNSGTEDKTAFYIRGYKKFASIFDQVGQKIIRLIMIKMKNNNSEYAKAENLVLRLLEKKDKSENDLILYLRNRRLIPEGYFNRIFDELKIQNMIEASMRVRKGKEIISFNISEFGIDYLKALNKD